MPKCLVEICQNSTRYENTRETYCPMHRERIKRHGYPELKRDAFQILEKLPHEFVDKFIKENCNKMIDREIVEKLRQYGYTDANEWTVRYRRRKLGVKKYLYGNVKKHKAWVRAQAIKKYGARCELCKYDQAIDTHHVIPKYQGGPHELENLMVVCPNCHALITRGILILKSRKEIPKIRRSVVARIKKLYRH